MMNVDFTKQENGDYTVTVECPFCGRMTRIENVPANGIFAWRGGALIQRAFPNMAIEDRECLVSGLCHECQEYRFSEPDEEEEEEAKVNA